jgi:hypothetical protein
MNIKGYLMNDLKKSFKLDRNEAEKDNKISFKDLKDIFWIPIWLLLLLTITLGPIFLLVKIVKYFWYL